jgi:hypothetical protein
MNWLTEGFHCSMQASAHQPISTVLQKIADRQESDWDDSVGEVMHFVMPKQS